MSYAQIKPEFRIGHKNMTRLPGLYGMRGMGQVAGVIPAGSQLTYAVTFQSPVLGNPLQSPAGIAAEVAQNVGANSGMVVVGSNASGSAFSLKSGFSLTVELTQDYTDEQMVQSVLDSAVDATGYSVVSSNITVIGMAAPGSNAPVAAAATDGTSWFDEDGLGLGMTNAGYLAIGAALVGGFFVVKQVL